MLDSAVVLTVEVVANVSHCGKTKPRSVKGSSSSRVEQFRVMAALDTPVVVIVDWAEIAGTTARAASRAGTIIVLVFQSEWTKEPMKQMYPAR